MQPFYTQYFSFTITNFFFLFMYFKTATARGTGMQLILLFYGLFFQLYTTNFCFSLLGTYAATARGTGNQLSFCFTASLKQPEQLLISSSSCIFFHHYSPRNRYVAFLLFFNFTQLIFAFLYSVFMLQPEEQVISFCFLFSVLIRVVFLTLRN